LRLVGLPDTTWHLSSAMQNTVTHHTSFRIFSHIPGMYNTREGPRGVFVAGQLHRCTRGDRSRETAPTCIRSRRGDSSSVASVPVDPGSEEYDAIERAEKALEILKRTDPRFRPWIGVHKNIYPSQSSCELRPTQVNT